MTGEAGPVGGGLALLNPLLCRPALIIEADDCAIRSGQGGDDEAYPGTVLPEMMIDLGNHSSWSVPGGSLIVEASIPHQRGVAGSAPGPGEQVLDRPLQHLIGREPDGVGHVPLFQCL